MYSGRAARLSTVAMLLKSTIVFCAEPTDAVSLVKIQYIITPLDLHAIL